MNSHPLAAKNSPVPKLAFSITELCEALAIGRTLAYQLIGSGKVRAFKLGTRTLIPASEVERLVKELSGSDE
jgi:excisionase family DNA binding protein